MKFFIVAIARAAGSVTLHRETVPTALKNAGVLWSANYFNVAFSACLSGLTGWYADGRRKPLMS